MSISKKLKWRRALSKIRFLSEELEYTQTISRESAPEFEAFYRKFCIEKNVNISELDKQHKERIDDLYGRNEIADHDAQEEPDIDGTNNTAITVHKENPTQNTEQYQMTADELAVHEAFSKLFKKIALKIHPDKIDNNLSDSEIKSRVNMFRNSLKALENKKYFILLDVAERFDISLPKNYSLQTRWMKGEIELLSELIAKEKNTYNYSFGVAETEEEKEQLIRKFLHQLFRMSIQ